MKEFIVLSETGVVLEGPDDTVHAKGTVLELDPANQQVIDLLANGTLGEVMSDLETEDFVVTEEFLAENPAVAGAGIQVGDTIRVPKEVVADETVAEEEVIAEEEAPVSEEDEVPAPTHAEPTMFYRGLGVLSDTIREVNGKEYHHLGLADGTHTDVTDEEYDAMVEATPAQ